MTSTIGIPIKLLNEAQVRAFISYNPHCLTLHPVMSAADNIDSLGPCRHSRDYNRSGVSWEASGRYSSSVLSKGGCWWDIIAEDNMNIQLKDITVTARDGRVSHLDQVYIRGSHVRFFIVPDMLRSVEPRSLRRRRWADVFRRQYIGGQNWCHLL